MEKYEVAEITIIEFEAEDVITASNCGGGDNHWCPFD